MSRWPYNTQRWQRVRANQLARQPMCELCAEIGPHAHSIRPATDVDHKVTIESGGAPFDPSNLQSMCHEHHSWKTSHLDRQGIAFADWQQRGCFSDGTPRDPAHPWFTGGPAGEA